MRPLAVLALLVLSAAAAAGQEAAHPETRRVGLLCWRETDASAHILEGVRSGLLRTRMALRFSTVSCGASAARAQEALAGWTAEGVELIVAVGSEAARFLAGRRPAVPVVFASLHDTEFEGETAASGAGAPPVTGAVFRLDYGRVLSLFRQAIPGLTILGVLATEGATVAAQERRSAEEALAAARERGEDGLVTLRAATAASADEEAIAEAVGELAAAGVQAIWIPEDPALVARLDFLERAANGAGLPLLATHPFGVRRTTVVGISPDYRKLGYRAAALAARRLRGGASPGAAPIETVRAHHVVINLKAAERAGVTVPLGALTRADVIVDRDGW